MKYRREVDGLRAVAVLPVIFFHADFALFSGGFVGVDVFFVISGYLITTIIYGEIREGTFSIVRFYERRARRILPALFFVTLSSIPFAWLWLMPDGFEDFAQSLAANSVFSSNILFWTESGYFDAESHMKPLLHTWSLAVEEQFYVFFPLFLMLLYRIGRSVLFPAVLAVFVISLAMSEWASTAYPTANFYLLPTRAWELGVGAILALTASAWIDKEGWLAEAGSGLGLAMILYSVFVFDDAVPFPGLWALIPVLGSGLVIALARPQTFVGRLLGSAPFVGIGLISYSAYLWHWPIFVFARVRMLNGVSPETYLALTVLSLFLAYISWRYVERVFRNKTSFTRQQIFSGGAIGSVAIMVFGMVGHFESGLPGRISPAAAEMAAWGEDRNPRLYHCHAAYNNFIAPEDSCIYGDDPSPSVAVYGDSHAMSLAHKFAEALEKEGHGLREFSYAGCAPVAGLYYFGDTSECDRFARAVEEFVFVQEHPDIVVFMARWILPIEGERFDNTEGGKVRKKASPALPLGEGPEFGEDPSRVDTVGRLYRASIQRFLDAGKRVILIYSVPEVGWNVPRYLASEIQYGIERTALLSTGYDVNKVRSKRAHAQLDLLEDHPNLVRIRPEELVCDTVLPGRCVAALDGIPIYYDDNHFNSIGMAMLSEKIVGAMNAKGWLEKP